MTKDNKKYLQKEFIEIQKGFFTCKKKSQGKKWK